MEQFLRANTKFPIYQIGVGVFIEVYDQAHQAPGQRP
jgi:hypothetical protein